MRKVIIAVVMAAILVTGILAQTLETPEPKPRLTAIVVIDPEAKGYGNGYGYCDQELSRLAKQETEMELEKKGFRVLVSTQDLKSLMDELKLEQSEWSVQGENRQPIGFFTGVSRVFYVSVSIESGGAYGGYWRAGSSAGGMVEEISVEVILREIDLKIRAQVISRKGTGTVTRFMILQAFIGAGKIETTRKKMSREAVRKAVKKTLSINPKQG